MKIILPLIVFIILFVAFVRYVESTGIFYPSRAITAVPSDIGFSFEDVIITTEDHLKLHGWLIRSPEAGATLLFFHGNAGNIADRLDKISLFHGLGVNVLIIDYRGYGKSEGRPTEEGIYRDAAAAYDYVRGRVDLRDQKIIAYGASLGGAVAIDLAAKRPLDCLIVDSTFSSARDMAKRIYPFIPSFLIKTRMDSVAKIGNITMPKLFFHSPDDHTVPIGLARTLYAAAPEPKKFVELKGDHNDSHLMSGVKIKNATAAFLKDLQLLKAP